MKELLEPCKSAIEKGLCFGCTGLAEADWKEPKDCIYADKKYKFKTNEGEQIKINEYTRRI